MSWSVADLALLDTLRPFLAEHGFKPVTSRSLCRRKTKTGFHELVWSSDWWPAERFWKSDYFEGSYGIGFRCDAIHEFWDVLDMVHGEANKRYAPTGYRSVGHDHGGHPFEPERDRSFRIRADNVDKDARAVAERIISMLSTDGFAWLEQFDDPSEIARHFNDPVMPEPKQLGGFLVDPVKRAQFGIAAACMTAPDTVPGLVEAWKGRIGDHDVARKGERGGVAVVKASDTFDQLVIRARELGYKVP